MAKKKRIVGADELNLSEKSNFTIQVNSLGEIIMNFSPEEINNFLDKNVKDKKLDIAETEELEAEDD
jgi:hypothetical protein